MQERHRIIDLVSDDVNKGMKELAGRKLVGFKDTYNNVRSTILPRGATHIEVTNTTTIKYRLLNDTKFAHLTPGLQPSQTYIIWTIVEEFTNVVCGDLAFMLPFKDAMVRLAVDVHIALYWQTNGKWSLLIDLPAQQ